MIHKIQIFDRKTGQWSKRYSLQPGFSESWVLDKTTDSGKNFIFHYEGIEPPEFDNMDWVRVLNLQSENESAIYTTEGLPLNHVQYLISDFQLEEQPTKEQWKITLVLTEVIERTTGIMGELLTYTNQTERVVSELIDNQTITTKYIKQPYNHLTALERFLKVTPANTNLQDSWYSRIKILDSEWLVSLPFTNTTFNELSLYNILLDNYDSSTGQTPVMYFDIDPIMDLPRDLSRDCYLLKFERQDGFDKPILEYKDLIKDCAARTISKSRANYATGLVSNIDNLVAENVINFPAQSLYAVPEVNRDIRNTVGIGQGDDWVIRFPHPIKRILKIEELELGGRRTSNLVGTLSYQLERNHKDLTNYVLERQQYLAADPNGDPTIDMNWIWFEEGKNTLHIKRHSAGATGTAAWGSTTKMYYVEYEPFVNCRIELGNMNFTQQINQTSAQPSAAKFGAFTAQYLIGMNKADITIEKNYDEFDYDIFKDHIGCRVKDGDKEYMITAMSYINRNLQYYVIYQLNENHLRKNNDYEASREVRTDTAIAIDATKERRTHIKQTVKLSFSPLEQSTHNQFLIDKKILLSALLPNQIDEKYYPQLALMQMNSKLQKEGGEIIDYEKTLIANVAQFIFDKQVCVNIQYFDNAEAGRRKESTISIRLNYPSAGDTSSYYFINTMRQVPVLYTNPFGEVEKLSVSLSSISLSLPNITSTNSIEFNRTLDTFRTMQALPSIPNEEIKNEILNNKCALINEINYYKDQLETANIASSFEAQSSEMIVCGDLLANSRLMKQIDGADSALKVYYFNQRQNESDLLNGQSRNITSIAEEASIKFNLPPISNEVQSIVICTQNNKKLLIINNISDKIREELSMGRLRIYHD